MKFNPVGWFEIYVDEMPRARQFYQSVFQVELDKLNSGDELEMWAFPWVEDGHGAAGALCKMTGMPPGGNSVMVYFQCEDCAQEEARAAEAGGKVMRPKTPIGEYGFISLVQDSEGNLIGLHSRR